MNVIDRYPLAPPTSKAQYEVGYRSLGLVMGVFAEADNALRNQLVANIHGVDPKPYRALSEQVGKLLTSAITGFLTQIRPEYLPSPSMLRHSLTLKENQVVMDGLDFSDPLHDEVMYTAASVAKTTFEWLHTKRKSRLIDFATSEEEIDLEGLDLQSLWWSGKPDIPRIWHSLIQTDALLQAAFTQPVEVPQEKRLRATHFCAAASQLLIEPLRPMTPQEIAEDKRGS